MVPDPRLDAGDCRAALNHRQASCCHVALAVSVPVFLAAVRNSGPPGLRRCRRRCNHRADVRASPLPLNGGTARVAQASACRGELQFAGLNLNINTQISSYTTV